MFNKQKFRNLFSLTDAYQRFKHVVCDSDNLFIINLIISIINDFYLPSWPMAETTEH